VIRLDRGGLTVLTWCTACPPWREVHTSTAAAHRAAARHADAVHADRATAAEHRRRAEETGKGKKLP
jgi:hypothetical protein